MTAFTARALEFFDSHGIAPKRLMTDNAWTYVKNRPLRELLAARAIRHLTIRPRRPQTNGKVERFQQTMEREWAYGLTYRSSDTERGRCHTGFATTTSSDPTQGSGTGRRSAAFTTSPGRTSRGRRRSGRRLGRWTSA